MSKTVENTQKLQDFICRKFEAKELDNDSLVKIIKQLGDYLNLQTVSDYARDNKMSYTGVAKFRTIEKIFNVKFVIDND